MQTIFAPATVPGKSGVAVIRVSGSSTRTVAQDILGRQLDPRLATLVDVKSQDGRVLDRGLAVFFPGPHSYTGEDVLELQLHRSVAVVNEVVSDLSARENCRLADPGEFTLRALQNGKMDVSQVEGLGDLLDAETELQREQAARIMSGSFSEFAQELRRLLVRAGALLEATIDFADEEIPEDVTGEVLDLLTQAREKMQVELAGFKMADRLRSGFEVAILGRPNVGKSTLLNAIARRDVALTSDIPGTTRDVLEVRVDLDGLPVTFLDTAGVRSTDDPIETLGVGRAVERAKGADLRVFLIDGGETLGIEPLEDDLVVESKADIRSVEGLAVSGLTGEGLGDLLKHVGDTLTRRMQTRGSLTRDRQFQNISGALGLIVRAEETVSLSLEHAEIAAADLRDGLLMIDSLVGRVDVDDYLDVVFSSFCLGK